MHQYDYDDLTGTPSKAELAVVRKHSMRYGFVFEHPPTEHCLDLTPGSSLEKRDDTIATRKRQAKLAPHSTSDLSLDSGLRERRALLNGITRKHKCQGKDRCKCGKLAAKPPRGIGMKHFMRDVVAQGKRRRFASVRKLNAHNRAGALLAIGIAANSVAAVAPLVRNHVRIVKAKDRGLI